MLVAEYQIKLPDKKLLEAKLHEFYELAESQAAAEILPQAAAKLPSNRKTRRPAKKKRYLADRTRNRKR